MSFTSNLSFALLARRRGDIIRWRVEPCPPGICFQRLITYVKYNDNKVTESIQRMLELLQELALREEVSFYTTAKYIGITLSSSLSSSSEDSWFTDNHYSISNRNPWNLYTKGRFGLILRVMVPTVSKLGAIKGLK